MNYAEAAEMCGVDETTVRQWRSRRYLAPIGRYHRRLLFLVSAVRAADEKARKEPGGRKRRNGERMSE